MNNQVDKHKKPSQVKPRRVNSYSILRYLSRILRRIFKQNKYINQIIYLLMVRGKKLNLNKITRTSFIMDAKDTELIGNINTQVRPIFDHGKEKVYITGFGRRFQVKFRKNPDTRHLEFYFGFISVPPEVENDTFLLKVNIHGVTKAEYLFKPSEDKFTNPNFVNMGRTYRWHKIQLPLHEYDPDIRLTLRLTGEEKGVYQYLVFGWSHFKLVDKQVVPINRLKNTGKHKNYVVILCDALRRDKLFTDLTPFINSIKDECRVIDPCYSTASWTWPSTASILTGKLPYNHGVYKFDRHKILPDIKTLPEIMQENGYLTVGCSSNPLITDRFGYNRGFDFFFHAGNFRPLSHLLFFFRRWLKKYRENNFFVYIHTMETHTPYDAPRKFKRQAGAPRKKYDDKKFQDYINNVNKHDDPELIPRNDLDIIKKYYDAEVLHFDDNLRDFFEVFKKAGVYDDTVFIILSDHGEEFLEHSNLTHGQALYESLVRIPCMIINSDIKPSPSSVRYTSMDLLPTILDLEGIEYATVLDGISFNSPDPDRDIFISSYSCLVEGEGPQPKFGVIYKDHKIIYYPRQESWEVYNLSEDEQEKNNLYKDIQGTQLFKDLKKRLDFHISKSDTKSVRKKGELESDLERTLEGMGYI